MATRRPDGGPAYPSQLWVDDGGQAIPDGFTEGLSLRQFYAAHAIQGILASAGEGTVGPAFAKRVAVEAFVVADAMIAAGREQSIPGPKLMTEDDTDSEPGPILNL